MTPDPPVPEDAPSIPPRQELQSSPQPTGNTVPPIPLYLRQGLSSHPVNRNQELHLQNQVLQRQNQHLQQLLDRAIAERDRAFRAQLQAQSPPESQARTPSAGTSRGLTPRVSDFQVDPDIPSTSWRSRTYRQEDFERGSRTPTDRYRSSTPVHGRTPRHSSRSSQPDRDRTPTRHDRGTSGQRNRTRHRRTSSEASSRSEEPPLRAGYPSLATQQGLTGHPEGFLYNPHRPTR